MNIQALKSFNARKRLSGGADVDFVPLPIGTYTAKLTEDGRLAVEKKRGQLGLSILKQAGRARKQ